VLDAPDPPPGSGRYHRAHGRRTWYGASSERDAWAEFIRSLPGGADPSEFSRKLGRVDFDVLLLDLTSPDLQRELGVTDEQLTSDDLTVCQALADLAVQAGFEAVLGPSAAAQGETTLAVFGPAITERATSVTDLGVRRAREL